MKRLNYTSFALTATLLLPAVLSPARAYVEVREQATTEHLLRQTPDTPDTSRARLVEALDSIARSPVEEGKIVGLSAAVVRGTDTLLLSSYGKAHLELDVPMPRDAIYPIRSVAKQFTAVAVLKLAERGRLDLDSEITEYFPDFSTRGQRITVRRLLDHTSGLVDLLEIPEARRLLPQALPRDSMLQLIASQPLAFEPGTAMSYSNSGYFLLGMIVEQVSERSHETYVGEELFEPLGMDHSRRCDNQVVSANRVEGYRADSVRSFSRGGYLDFRWLLGSAGLCSSAGDLVTWQRALHEGRVLSENSYREMVTPDTLLHGHRLRYAKGLEVRRDASGHRVFRHSGRANGFAAETRYYPDSNLEVVVLSNTYPPSAVESTASDLARRVLGEAAAPEEVPYGGDLEELVGRFVGQVGGARRAIVIDEEQDRLVARMSSNRPPWPLRHLGEGRFATPGLGHFLFVLEAGRAQELHVDLGLGGHFSLERQQTAQEQ